MNTSQNAIHVSAQLLGYNVEELREIADGFARFDLPNSERLRGIAKGIEEVATQLEQHAAGFPLARKPLCYVMVTCDNELTLSPENSPERLQRIADGFNRDENDLGRPYRVVPLYLAEAKP